MKIKVENIEFNLLTPKSPIANKTPIIFIHGFTGSADDWKPFLNKLPKQFYPIAIDLIGHGKSFKPSDKNFYTTKQIVEQLNLIIKTLNLKQVILCGYSMGGRIALSYAIKYPTKIKALILESTTAGIEDKHERILRIKQDKSLAKFLAENGVKKFIEHWMKLPLFESLKNISKQKYLKLVRQKKKNSSVGLANTLLGFSTGRMPSYWNKLKNIKCKTLLITGELDKKFTDINKKMRKEISNAKFVVIKNAGHNTHLEKAKEFLFSIRNFLLSLK